MFQRRSLREIADPQGQGSAPTYRACWERGQPGRTLAGRAGSVRSLGRNYWTLERHWLVVSGLVPCLCRRITATDCRSQNELACFLCISKVHVNL